MKAPQVIAKSEMQHLEYEVLISRNTNRDAMLWCEEYFGERWNPVSNRQGKWSMFWKGSSSPFMYRFCFAEEHDIMLFMLRWSGND